MAPLTKFGLACCSTRTGLETHFLEVLWKRRGWFEQFLTPQSLRGNIMLTKYEKLRLCKQPIRHSWRKQSSCKRGNGEIEKLQWHRLSLSFGTSLKRRQLIIFDYSNTAPDYK